MSYLGKRFQQYINDSLDQSFINDRRRRFENLKLEILDACEFQEEPPTFHDVDWVHKIWIHPKYAFLFGEFKDWLKWNGLDYDFNTVDGEILLKIAVYKYTDFEKIPELDLTSWLEKIKK